MGAPKRGFSLIDMLMLLGVVGLITAIMVGVIKKKALSPPISQWTAAESTATAKEAIENNVDLWISTEPEVIDHALGLSRAEVISSDGKVWIRVIFPTILELKKDDKVGVKIVQALQPNDPLSWFYFAYRK